MLKSRDCFWACNPEDHKANRPGLVFKVEDSIVTVLFGTSTKRFEPKPILIVTKNEGLAQQWRLSNDTFFYPNLQKIQLAELAKSLKLTGKLWLTDFVKLQIYFEANSMVW